MAAIEVNSIDMKYVIDVATELHICALPFGSFIFFPNSHQMHFICFLLNQEDFQPLSTSQDWRSCDFQCWEDFLNTYQSSTPTGPEDLPF